VADRERFCEPGTVVTLAAERGTSTRDELRRPKRAWQSAHSQRRRVPPIELGTT
jgi:hypothetical protein